MCAANNNVSLTTVKADMILTVMDYPIQASFRLLVNWFSYHTEKCIFNLCSNGKYNTVLLAATYKDKFRMDLSFLGLCFDVAVPCYFLQCRSCPLEGGSVQGCQGLYNHLLHLGDRWTLAARGFDPHYSPSDLRLLGGFKPAGWGCRGVRLIEVSRWRVCYDLCGDRQCNYTAGQKEHYSS